VPYPGCGIVPRLFVLAALGLASDERLISTAGDRFRRFVLVCLEKMKS